MPDGNEPVTIRLVERIAEIEAAAWDALAGDSNPTVSHAFLACLEDSGSASAETGWAYSFVLPSGSLTIVAIILRPRILGRSCLGHPRGRAK